MDIISPVIKVGVQIVVHLSPSRSVKKGSANMYAVKEILDRDEDILKSMIPDDLRQIIAFHKQSVFRIIPL